MPLAPDTAVGENGFQFSTKAPVPPVKTFRMTSLGLAPLEFEHPVSARAAIRPAATTRVVRLLVIMMAFLGLAVERDGCVRAGARHPARRPRRRSAGHLRRRGQPA